MADDFLLNTDGTITFDLGDVTRVLRRPTLGQYRRAIEALGLLRDGAVDDSGEIPETSSSVKIQLDLMVGWFDDVFTALAGEGLPRTAEGMIDDDRLPSWLLSGDVIRDIVAHWQAVPSRRGGR